MHVDIQKVKLSELNGKEKWDVTIGKKAEIEYRGSEVKVEK